MASSETYYITTLPITEKLTASSLTVTIDGSKYTLASNGDGTYGGGRAPNSIGIYRENDANYMVLNDNSFSSGNHSIVIQEDTSSIETTECFKKAVQSVSVMMLTYDGVTISGATWQEAHDALTNGAMIYLKRGGEINPCVGFDNAGISFSHTYVNGVVYTDEYVWKPNGSVINNSITYPPQQAG